MKSMKRSLRFVVGIAVLSVLAFGAPTAWAHKNLANLTAALSANPVIDGTSVDIAGTLQYSGSPGAGSATGHTLFPSNGVAVVNETVQIQELQLGGAGVPCGTAGASFVGIATGQTNGSGQFSTSFDTTGLGGSTIYFRAHHAAEGGTHGTDQSTSLGLDLAISALSSCTPGATIAADLASGDGTPPPSTAGAWTFRVKVKACGDLTGVTAQGGSNGWAPMVSFAPSGGAVTVRNNKKNQVLTWNIGDMLDGAEASLLITVSGTTGATCDSVQYLSGPWSAMASTDGGATFTKSDYTGRVSLTVSCIP